MKANFFCIFKTGDNINLNLETLGYFYELYDNADPYHKQLLHKPIIILLISIIEAILHDFYVRIKANIWEKVSNMADDILLEIRDKEIDELSKYIAHAKKHDFFKSRETNLYAKLDELRKIRNRIHIQNKYVSGPASERAVFTKEVKISAEKCLEKVIKIMSSEYSRPKYLNGHVKDLQLPWTEHFPSD